jgi:hypothetical protein
MDLFISFLTHATESAHRNLLGLITLIKNLNVFNTMGKDCPVTCQAGAIRRRKYTLIWGYERLSARSETLASLIPGKGQYPF